MKYIGALRLQMEAAVIDLRVFVSSYSVCFSSSLPWQARLWSFESIPPYSPQHYPLWRLHPFSGSVYRQDERSSAMSAEIRRVCKASIIVQREFTAPLSKCIYRPRLILWVVMGRLASGPINGSSTALGDKTTQLWKWASRTRFLNQVASFMSFIPYGVFRVYNHKPCLTLTSARSKWLPLALGKWKSP